DHWSTFGEVVVMVLIQVGGLGYMVGTTVVLWALGRKMGLRDQNMLRIYYGAPSMSETLSFARSVGLFTLYFEAAGTVVLTLAALAHGEPLGDAAWWGFFHSVSAFNNAGFALTDIDVATYAGSPAVILALVVLITAGSLGYLPIAALVARRSFRRLALDHKLVLSTAAVLLVLGVTFTAAAEWTNDDTLGAMPVEDRPFAALFHTANRTAGFSVFDVGAMHDETKLATIGLMFVGGAAGSTAGGLKLGAFALLLAVMVASLRGERDVTVFWRRVPRNVIQQATTLALFHVALVFGFAVLLTLGTDLIFIDVLFEAVSAVCTVGFSAAGTLAFGSVGHWILISAMLVGRFAPLMLLLYMTRPRRHVAYHHPEDSVRLG
ncbi:MAG: potassium transporter TrkG, partial [Tepidiformaceae bacterium]